MRVWSAARTEAEIRDNMNKVLDGDESRLVAYYRFDHVSGTMLDDLTANNNDGKLNNMAADDWVASTAPIGSGDIQSQNHVRAIWKGGNTTAGPAGLIITNTSFLQATGDDIVFGHNNFTGNTTSDLPGGWINGQRWTRVWYFSKSDAGSNGGNVDITFDFSAGGMSGRLAAFPATTGCSNAAATTAHLRILPASRAQRSPFPGIRSSLAALTPTNWAAITRLARWIKSTPPPL